MTLTTDLQVQVRRVEQYRMATADRDLERARTQAADMVVSLRAQVMRLKAFTPLCPPFSMNLADECAEIDRLIRSLVLKWNQSKDQLNRLHVYALQDDIKEISDHVIELIDQTESSARGYLRTYELDIARAERVSEILNVDTPSRIASRRRAQATLRRINDFTERRGDLIGVDLSALSEFEQSSSASVCLREARVPDDLMGLVDRMLDQEFLPLNELTQAELISLHASPILAPIFDLAFHRPKD